MMNFPITKFARRNGVWQQFFHLVSEVWEIFWALLWRNYAHAGRETVDAQQSADTLRWALHFRHGVDRDMAAATVIEGNRQRGYYEVETLCAHCAHADVSCPVYPTETQTCREYRQAGAAV
jgi:hypothetical protein